MFSSTVMRLNSCVIWKVRPTRKVANSLGE